MTSILNVIGTIWQYNGLLWTTGGWSYSWSLSSLQQRTVFIGWIRPHCALIAITTTRARNKTNFSRSVWPPPCLSTPILLGGGLVIDMLVFQCGLNTTNTTPHPALIIIRWVTLTNQIFYNGNLSQQNIANSSVFSVVKRVLVNYEFNFYQI